MKENQIVRKLWNGLSKTRNKLGKIFATNAVFKDSSLEKSISLLEESLLSADLGYEAVTEIVARLKSLRRASFARGDLKEDLRKVLTDLLEEHTSLKESIVAPHTIMVVGVNGTGKTTSIAKLAKIFKNNGKKVLLVAADTYRAAGVLQLSLWAERVGVDVLSSEMGQDPAAVAFDAIESGLKKKYEAIIIDTAGRLHTRKNLMGEIKKVERVLGKKREDLPQDTFLVLDATTGQNGISQAKSFKQELNITGIILTKIDGTAKGGVVFPIMTEIGIPIMYIGVGEESDDIVAFQPDVFVASLLNGVVVS